MIEIFWPAFAVSIVLLGIHSYFGLEIIKRGILFTDLAIGQLAALGSAIALLCFEGRHLYACSLGMALAGGLLIGLASRRERNIEPLIGLLYALGLAGVFLLLSRSAHGTEEIQKLMAYDILFTPMEDVIKTAAIYLGLGGVLWACRRLSGLWRELVFFLTFAATVTSSVKLAGVLVVFALLVAPALVAAYLPFKHKLPIAWAVGTAVNLAALYVSFKADLPTGYTIVFAQAAVALIAALIAIAAGRSLNPLSAETA